MSDNPFDPSVWQPVESFDLTDITYQRQVVDGKKPVGEDAEQKN